MATDKNLSKKNETASLAFKKASDLVKKEKYQEAFTWFTLAGCLGHKKSDSLAEGLVDKNLISEKEVYNAWMELSKWFSMGKNVEKDLKLASNFKSMAEDSPWGAED